MNQKLFDSLRIIDEQVAVKPLWDDERIVEKWRQFTNEYSSLIAMTQIRDEYEQQLNEMRRRLGLDKPEVENEP